MVTKCSGLTMCEGFTSLTAVQMGEYYHDVKISSLEYADNYELPYTLSFENNRREEIYFSVRQSKKFRNGTEFVSDVSQFAKKKAKKRDAFVGIFFVWSGDVNSRLDYSSPYAACVLHPSRCPF